MAPRLIVVSLCLSFSWAACSGRVDQGSGSGLQPGPDELRTSPILLPTGAYITPLAADGSVFQTLNPGLESRPDFLAGQAVTSILSPDGATLLVLTSGYNRNRGPDGQDIPGESNEYVFVFDATVDPPAEQQVLQIRNTFDGMAWLPSGDAFLVSGGVDDNVHLFRRKIDGLWAESLPPIALGHQGLHPLVPGPQAAGIAVSASGNTAVVANFENDSATILDLNSRSVVADVELRPGKIDPSQRGVPGGELPLWVAIKGDDKAYVSSTRDRQVVVIDLSSQRVIGRILVGGQPNRMIFNRSQTRLFVSNGNSDSVSVIDTSTDAVVEEINVTAPHAIFANRARWKGSNPNSLALSPDEGTLYVTNGGTNSVAVVQFGRGAGLDAENDLDQSDEQGAGRAKVVGLIPTGWYPNSVVVSADGQRLFVVNGKTNAGPNEGACRDSLEPNPPPACRARNQYVLQLEKAGLLSLPLPSGRGLARLTRQVGINNHFLDRRDPYEEQVMQFLRQRIHHVIYIIKENRTYDQVLGDLEVGNGDPQLTLFPEPTTPNHHALARQFVTLDSFFDSGEVSGVGWNWSTAARTTDIIEKTQFVNYAGRGLSYDWEGTNRNINVGLATVEERQEFQPLTPDDPDLLPGAIDYAGPEAPGDNDIAEYLWDAALRAGLSIRNYGCFGDLSRYQAALPGYVPIVPNPAEQGIRQFFPTKAALMDNTDVYFRGYDMMNADYYNFKEWEREFDQFVAAGELPALQFVRFPHDHLGSFGTALYGLNTPEKQIADNDYAVGLLVSKVARSPFAGDTLIFILEDDAQDGPDHIDAHRSVGYVVGPYVRQGTVVSRPYNTVSMLRTIEEVLGLEPIGLNDGLARPMTDVFEPTPRPRPWTYEAIYPEVLRTTEVPAPPGTLPSNTNALLKASAWPLHDAEYWERASAGQNFEREDAVDSATFNRILWRGIKGENVPYPTVRDQRDLSVDREQLLMLAN